MAAAVQRFAHVAVLQARQVALAVADDLDQPLARLVEHTVFTSCPLIRNARSVSAFSIHLADISAVANQR
jgi:hypothetical protein